MGDSQNKDGQAKGKQAPTWVSLVTVISSVISAVLVALIGYFGKAEVERLNASIREAEVALEQRRFEAEQRARRDEIMTTYIPKLLGDESDRDIATAVLFVIYPNEASRILEVVAESLSDDESATVLKQTVEQAVILDKITGDWAIVIGSYADLESAHKESQLARERGDTPTIYLRNGVYATTMGPFPSQTEAESVNIAVRSMIRSSAFVINLTSWCPQPEPKEERGIDYLECPQQSQLVHLVQEGETLLEIANRYDVTPEDIAKSNNMRPDIIYVGQRLLIPTK